MNSSALMGFFHGIVDLDIDLRAVEGTTTSIDLPRFSKVVESDSESSLSLIPKIIVSEPIFRSSRKFQIKFKAKEPVNMVQEI